VFTSFVGQAGGRDAEAIRLVLEMAYESALVAMRREHGRSWAALVNRGAERLRALAVNTPVEVTEALTALAEDELTAAVVAARRGIAGKIASELARRFEAISPLQEELRDLGGGSSFEARTLRRRIRSLRRSVAPWASGSRLRAVERYTGAENRKARDRASTAFREIGPPWILVASNVGSEGIDLHTYTRRIVHYDLEWNPARMEQREGRGDRVGRKLSGKMQVLYCLVPDTYDERMFHQLVARDRWHGVLLGKPSTRLKDEDLDVALLDQRRLARMRLNLAPTVKGGR
jgi:hypothetical protein